MLFSVDAVRAQFPALQPADGRPPLAFLDGPGGTQMAQAALDGMVRYIRGGMANMGGAFPTSVATEAVVAEARQATADLLGCTAREVAFGPNMTTLAFSLARALASHLQPGDDVLVTELDHRANVDPWLTAARDRGATVRFIPVDTETLTLRLDLLDELLTPRTRLVAVGLSSNVTGTVTPVAEVVRRAQAVGALTVVDAVHAAAHLPLDFAALGCDVLLCSAYKFFGPHVGVAAVRAALFEQLPVYKLAPASPAIPGRLETGTQNHEGLAGLLGALTFLESLGSGPTRRARLQQALAAIEAHEAPLAQQLEDFLRQQPRIRLYRPAAGTPKTATLAFTVAGLSPREVTTWLAGHHRLCVADGHFYATTLAERLGVLDHGGWVRVGLAPYTTAAEVARLQAALLELLGHQ